MRTWTGESAVKEVSAHLISLSLEAYRRVTGRDYEVWVPVHPLRESEPESESGSGGLDDSDEVEDSDDSDDSDDSEDSDV